jgi:hypothetical protein
MDIKDGFTTSSKEQLRSLVRVYELDEITSNGGKDRSVTKEHPRGLKRKRPAIRNTESHSHREAIHKLEMEEGDLWEKDRPTRRKHPQVENEERRHLLTVKFHQPSHEFTFGVGMSFISYPLVLTPLV